jgi:hypothetical protein
MTIKVEDERNGIVNNINTNILSCVDFWNREGIDIYKRNQIGTMGSDETNAMALLTPYDDFVLDMLLLDCKTFIKSKQAIELETTFECGRNRSHVWVHENGNRILMLHVEK